jgi:hypothetical protein
MVVNRLTRSYPFVFIQPLFFMVGQPHHVLRDIAPPRWHVLWGTGQGKRPRFMTWTRRLITANRWDLPEKTGVILGDFMAKQLLNVWRVFWWFYWGNQAWRSIWWESETMRDTSSLIWYTMVNLYGVSENCVFPAYRSFNQKVKTNQWIWHTLFSDKSILSFLLIGMSTIIYSIYLSSKVYMVKPKDCTDMEHGIHHPRKRIILKNHIWVSLEIHCPPPLHLWVFRS